MSICLGQGTLRQLVKLFLGVSVWVCLEEIAVESETDSGRSALSPRRPNRTGRWRKGAIPRSCLGWDTVVSAFRN